MNRINMGNKKLNYLGKQPIFNTGLNVIGNELLYRDSFNNKFPIDIEAGLATSLIVNAFTEHEDKFSTNIRHFVNFDHRTILNRLPLLLDNKRVVIEILESCYPNEELLSAVKELHSKGYCLALDDFDFKTNWTAFYPYITIIKVCLHQVDIFNKKFKKYISQLKKYNLILLAEKVETKEEFLICKKMGFSLFQGNLLAKPKVEHFSTTFQFNVNEECYLSRNNFSESNTISSSFGTRIPSLL